MEEEIATSRKFLKYFEIGTHIQSHGSYNHQQQMTGLTVGENKVLFDDARSSAITDLEFCSPLFDLFVLTSK